MAEIYSEAIPASRLQKQAIDGVILAFDFGKRRIGVAIGNTAVITAQPLMTINTEVTEQRFARIAELIKNWQPVLLVVGLPLHSDGAAHELTRLSQRFARRLQGRFNIQVVLQDERYTSEVASAELNAIGIYGREQRSFVDQYSAQQILQSFFDEQYAITKR